jgi:hypothetical protein
MECTFSLLDRPKLQTFHFCVFLIKCTSCRGKVLGDASRWLYLPKREGHRSTGKDDRDIHLAAKRLCVRPYSLCRDWDLFLICGLFFRRCPCPCCCAIRITRYSCSSVSLLIYSSSRSSPGTLAASSDPIGRRADGHLL